MLLNLNGKSPTVAPGSIILVTGVNGYIASHVADQLIQAGYIVRGTTRDIAKTAWVKKMFEDRYGPGKFGAVVVNDMAEPGAFDEACKGELTSRDIPDFTYNRLCVQESVASSMLPPSLPSTAIPIKSYQESLQAL